MLYLINYFAIMIFETIKKCVIIGSGPAGYSAAIYAARADLNPVLYTGLEVGGQLNTTTAIENYPGFPEQISGPELMEKFKTQAIRFNTDIKHQEVIKVELSSLKNQYHILYLNDGKIIKTKGLIIATGATPKYLGLTNEKDFIGKGISSCAVCDGFFYKGKTVAVIGGGDSALEATNYLSKICNKIYLIVRKNVFKGSKFMQNRTLKLKNVRLLFNHEIIKIIGNDYLQGIEIINKENNNNQYLTIDGLFISIGHIPNTWLFKKQLMLNNHGYIITDGKTTQTNQPGVFACGDVQDPIYRQAITSAGTGCMAALDLERYIYEQ